MIETEYAGLVNAFRDLMQRYLRDKARLEGCNEVHASVISQLRARRFVRHLETAWRDEIDRTTLEAEPFDDVEDIHTLTSLVERVLNC